MVEGLASSSPSGIPMQSSIPAYVPLLCCKNKHLPWKNRVSVGGGGGEGACLFSQSGSRWWLLRLMLIVCLFLIVKWWERKCPIFYIYILLFGGQLKYAWVWVDLRVPLILKWRETTHSCVKYKRWLWWWLWSRSLMADHDQGLYDDLSPYWMK